MNARGYSGQYLVYNAVENSSLDLSKSKTQLQYECILQDKMYLEEAYNQVIFILGIVKTDRNNLRTELAFSEQLKRNLSSKIVQLKDECEVLERLYLRSKLEINDAQNEIAALKNVVQNRSPIRRATVPAKPVSGVYPLHPRSLSVSHCPPFSHEPIYENMRYFRRAMVHQGNFLSAVHPGSGHPSKNSLIRPDLRQTQDFHETHRSTATPGQSTIPPRKPRRSNFTSPSGQSSVHPRDELISTAELPVIPSRYPNANSTQGGLSNRQLKRSTLGQHRPSSRRRTPAHTSPRHKFRGYPNSSGTGNEPNRFQGREGQETTHDNRNRCESSIHNRRPMRYSLTIPPLHESSDSDMTDQHRPIRRSEPTPPSSVQATNHHGDPSRAIENHTCQVSHPLTPPHCTLSYANMFNSHRPLEQSGLMIPSRSSPLLMARLIDGYPPSPPRGSPQTIGSPRAGSFNIDRPMRCSKTPPPQEPSFHSNPSMNLRQKQRSFSYPQPEQISICERAPSGHPVVDRILDGSEESQISKEASSRLPKNQTSLEDSSEHFDQIFYGNPTSQEATNQLPVVDLITEVSLLQEVSNEIPVVDWSLGESQTSQEAINKLPVVDQIPERRQTSQEATNRLPVVDQVPETRQTSQEATSRLPVVDQILGSSIGSQDSLEMDS